MNLRPEGQRLHRATAHEFVLFLAAYLDLLVIYWEAKDQGESTSSGRLPLSHFTRRDIPKTILRWMLYQGHIDHYRATNDAKGHQAIVVACSLLFDDRSSFALTERGEKFMDVFLVELFSACHAHSQADFDRQWDKLILGELPPRYDGENHLFSWGCHLLKHFRQPSQNQELVLAAAEELGWVAWFDDPLPRRPGKNPKVRLHDTIKDLNRRQVKPLIHFIGDGSGSKIGWEYR